MRGLSLLLGAGVIGAAVLAFTQASSHAEAYEDPPPPLGANATEDDPGAMPDEADPQLAPGAQNPHGSPSAAKVDVPVGKVDKAKGPNARRVAELFAQKKTLDGKPVRVRGVVVKSMSGVMGKTFFHLRDGSGEESKSNNDITVTSDAEPKVGDTITIEGSVVLDKDLGAGYRYDVMIEQAHVIDE